MCLFAHAPEEAVEAESLATLPHVHRISAFQSFYIRELRIAIFHAGLYGARHRIGLRIERTGHGSRGRKIIALVNLGDFMTQGASHREPHDLLDTFRASATDELAMRHAGERERI